MVQSPCVLPPLFVVNVGFRQYVITRRIDSQSTFARIAIQDTMLSSARLGNIFFAGE
jgi:hypothetical protein